jgi:broad specificity phosphatase PhoE
MRLLLVRHGETHLNVKRCFSGQLDDELTPKGMLQAEALSERLAEETLDSVISSDLSRAYKTAQAIARRHDLVVETDPRLREIGMGAWEGVGVAEVEAREADLIARWRADPSRYYPAGGESLDDLEQRIRLSLSYWQERYQTAEQEPTLVWVTHGAFIGVMLCTLLGLPPDRRRHLHTDNASLSEIQFFGTNQIPIIRCLNDTAHLRTQGLWKPSHGSLYIK